MANDNNNSSVDVGMQLLTVTNKVTKPQDTFEFRKMIGVDENGESIITVDMETDFEDNYFVLFFFPMDFKVDSSEVLSFKEHLDAFTENHCKIVGVTSDSPLAVKRWIIKEPSCGGFGGSVGFPILCDKDLSLSMSMGVAMDNGSPARATFIIDWTGRIRYMMSHRSDIGRSVKEILRLVQAFRHSDLTGQALASGWVPGGEVIPTDFTKKVEYFTNKFGHGRKGEKAKNNQGSTVNTSGAAASDEERKEKTNTYVNEESKKKMTANPIDESKEKSNANTKVKEPSDKDAGSSVSTATTGSGKLRPDDKSSLKGGSGTPSDVSDAGKTSLMSNKGTDEKRKVSVEDKTSEKEK